MNWIHLNQERNQWRVSCENGNESLGPFKCLGLLASEEELVSMEFILPSYFAYLRKKVKVKFPSA
jgi:hypothetical protein